MWKEDGSHGDCKDPKFVSPAGDNVIPTPSEPVEAQKPVGGGDAQLGDKNGNPKTSIENPVKVGEKEISVPDSAELDHGDWLVVTRRKRSPPKNPQLPHNNDKAAVAGLSKNVSGPTTKVSQHGPGNDVGPYIKNQTIRLDSGKRRRQDKSTPTHVLLKNVGKDIYVNPMHTGTPVLETGALLAPQTIFSGAPFFDKVDPPPSPKHGTQLSSPVHVSSTPSLDQVDVVPDSQTSQHAVVPNDVSMYE
ncbi:hypothetical protein RIF29_14100 [Crotalaria pallida]|uniref:Uncharacterized protein n=1 Tax=Crotalaria pallida TaxID=3830 RepID=A0AAN9ICG0_CROPI